MSNIFYVNNLSQTSDLAQLEFLFSTVGDVKNLQLEMYPETSRGFAVVEMETDQQAADCVERFRGESAFGQALSITLEKLPVRVPGAVSLKKLTSTVSRTRKTKRK